MTESTLVDPTESRQRDAERTRQKIIQSGRVLFAENGLGSTTLEAIAQAAGIDKKLIYYYFKNKDGLFLAVLEDAIGRIREAETHLKLAELEPIDAIKKLIRFSWEYYLENPEFVRLINSENLHRAEHLAQSKKMPGMNQPFVEALGLILERGRSAGVFRGGVDPLQLYLSLVGLTYYYISNQHTISLMFKRDLMSPRALEERLAHVTDVIMGYLIRN